MAASGAAPRKNETKLRKTEKNMEKENNTDESVFSENEIPDLNSLKPLEFEPKNMGVTNNSQKQPAEVFCNKRCSLKFCKIHRKTPVPESY